MLTRIIFRLFLVLNISSASFAVTDQELAEFSNSPSWLNLYNYEKTWSGNYKNKSHPEYFFFAKEGPTSPYQELKRAIEEFSRGDKKWGTSKLSAACTFPARLYVINKQFPSLKLKKDHCDEFLEFKKNIGGEDLSMLYVGSYPGNPASMFGHSFLRVKNKSRTWLRDYTIAFLANVAKGDGPITYTVKGMTGGYQGFYQIKPYYINAASYNNQESRDIWEYPLNFSKEEFEFFIMHLWEVSLNTTYPYYFLDENCGYYLLTLLEAVRPKTPLVRDSSLLFHPIETLKKVSDGKGYEGFRPAIKRLLKQKIELMNEKQRNEYQSAKANLAAVDKAKSTLVLDALIDYWKYKNYSEKLQLDSDEKALMEKTLLKRSKLGESIELEPLKEVSPDKIHRPSKVSMMNELNQEKRTLLELKWGYHGINDSEEGVPRWSFIDYLGIRGSYDDGDFELEKIYLVDIRALEDSSVYMIDLSWRASLNVDKECRYCNEDYRLIAIGGIGLSDLYDKFLYWGFLQVNNELKLKKQKIYPTVEVGGKFQHEKFSTSFLGEAYYQKKTIYFESLGQLNFHFSEDLSSFVSHKYVSEQKKNQYLAGLKLHY